MSCKLPHVTAEANAKAFLKAKKFIIQAEKNNGVDAPVSKTFKVKGTKDVRVDIEVIKGKAFISILFILTGMILWIYYI